MRTEPELMAEWEKGRLQKEQLSNEVIRARAFLRKAQVVGHNTTHEESVLAHALARSHITDGILKGLEWAMGSKGSIFTDAAST